MTITEFFRQDSMALPRRHAALLLPVVTGIALAIVGAFGTYVGMSLLTRLLHFVTGALLITALVIAVTALVRRYLFSGAEPLWAAIGVAVAVAPIGGWIVHQLLWLLAPRVLPFVTYRDLALQVLSINLFLGPLIWAIRRMPAEATDLAIDPAQPASPPDTCCSFRSKLPFAVRNAAVLSLSAEDHYVRVRTDRGEALILINLADAVAALGPETGVRIHRSHWVAHAAIRGLARQSGRLGVRLDHDLVLPVSRAGQKLLRNQADRVPSDA
ncbi:LytTR family DNA-binding domain-containing protein [Bradyrhizobium viridifuturi]|uniref:LytTR family DNA-binding domain-containing protein n=1 Tax=Bradyrhizobium viridifuturi TaxID=1654716 RepID=UPI00067ECEF5|nr:LytTR family DNA-binding domain-containing protein [Bradyrhizobium viridifuturi]